jgi:hypothetical protein
MPDAPRLPTVKAGAGLFVAYDETFSEIMATLKGFSQSEIDAMHQLITKGEGGHLNQGRYHMALFQNFFKGREWVWPEFERWENALQHKGVYALLVRTLMFRASSLHNRRRQAALGITHAIWLHSGAGLSPRPSHVAFSGRKYEIAKGAFLDGKWTWPGVEIDCKCVSNPVIPGFT